MFSQLLSGTRKDQACQNQGGAHNIIMTAVETVTITEPKGKGRTSLEKCGERRATATLLSTVPGGYRNPFVSTLGVQPAETWCPNQGLWGPRCRDWGGGVALETEDLCPRFSPGDCVSSPHPHGSGSCSWRPPSALYLQWVLSPLRFPSSELRVLPRLTCGPYSSPHLVAFT